MTFQLAGLDHVAIAVRDLKASQAWYEEVLGLERRYANVWGDVPTMLFAGSTCVALFPRREDAGNDFPEGGRPALLHFAFRGDRENFERAQASLGERGIPFEFQDHTISHSIYFRDPDDYRLEITTYEV